MGLAAKGFVVDSFGTNTYVRLPGTSAGDQNVFQFGTKYEDMYKELKSKDAQYYSHNGTLKMLKDNASVKPCPERWQDSTKIFDAVVCFDERVYDSVVDDLQSRGGSECKAVHVINISTKDDFHHARTGAKYCYHLCDMLQARADVDDEIEDVIQEFE